MAANQIEFICLGLEKPGIQYSSLRILESMHEGTKAGQFESCGANTKKSDKSRNIRKNMVLIGQFKNLKQDRQV